MRDISRIPRITDVLEDIWRRVPQWRLGQLIENIKVFSGKDDLFYIEDDEMENILKEFFGRIEEFK